MTRSLGRRLHERSARGPHWLATLGFLMVSEFRSRYRAQALGVVWSLLSPVAMTAALALVLGPAFRPQNAHYTMFLFVGLVFWSFVSSSTNAAVGSLVIKRDIVKRAVVRRELVPISVMLSYTLNLAIELCALVAISPFVPGSLQLSPALLAVPVLVVELIVLLAGVALLGAALNALYRDFAYITTTALGFLFWLTPIVYPLASVPEPYRHVLALNPLAELLEGIRGATMDGTAPDLTVLATGAAWALAALAIGIVSFRRLEAEVLDRV